MTWFFPTLSPPGCFSILPCCTNDLLELRIRVAPEWQMPPCPMARNEATTRREILCITWMILYVSARSIVLSQVSQKRLLKLTAFCVWSTHNCQRFTHTKLSLPNVAFSGKRPWEPKTTAGDLSSVPFHPIFCFSSGKKTNLQKSLVSLIVSPCLSHDLQDLYHRWICIGCHQGFVLFKGRRARRPLQRSSLWLIAPDEGLHCLAMFGSLENSKLDKNRLKRAAT